MTEHSRFYSRAARVVWAATLFAATAAAQPQRAGEVEFARGAATAQRPDEPARIIGRGESFYPGEVLSTGDKSFAVVSLEDGSRLTLRPETRFVVESINAEKSEQAGGLMRLFKGGVRAVTGFISKFNKDGLKLETPVATMGIRGTEFDARLCQGDCPGSGQPEAGPEPTAARIAFSRGRLSVRRPDGSQQPVDTGAGIEPGDRVVAGDRGVAVLVFRDNSRVTVQPDSELVVRRYEYDKQEPEQGESLLELVRGGLRAVSGLLGKVAPDRVKVDTPVATVGIRGTGFDLLCKGRCEQPIVSQWAPERLFERLASMLIRPAYAQPQLPDNGMYAYAWSGRIELQTAGGESFIVDENSAAFLANRQSEPIALPDVPEVMRDNPHQRPDRLDADPDELFSRRPDPRLYVSVYDGEVSLGDTVLGKGQAAFTGRGEPGVRRLDTIPDFMQGDAFPRPSDFKPSVYRLLNELDAPEDDFECTLQ